MPDACKHEAGVFSPTIDRNRCEGKEEWMHVCTYDVFELGSLSAEDRKRLSLIGRLKAFAHGGKQAFAVRLEACHACGLCVTACPEKALRLVRR